MLIYGVILSRAVWIMGRWAPHNKSRTILHKRGTVGCSGVWLNRMMYKHIHLSFLIFNLIFLLFIYLFFCIFQVDIRKYCVATDHTFHFYCVGMEYYFQCWGTMNHVQTQNSHLLEDSNTIHSRKTNPQST